MFIISVGVTVIVATPFVTFAVPRYVSSSVINSTVPLVTALPSSPVTVTVICVVLFIVVFTGSIVIIALFSSACRLLVTLVVAYTPLGSVYVIVITLRPASSGT